MKRVKCKAKKGFTLVEIIVVIAIIGVLAMILIPTMMNFVTSAEVTSMNSTAASIKKQVDAFMTNADTAGYGMALSPTNLDTLTITIVQGEWTISTTGSAIYDSSGGFTWNSGTGEAHRSKVGVTDACGLLAINLATSLPEVYSGCAMISLKGGKCLAVAFTDETNSGLTAGTHYPALVAGEFPASFVWNGSYAGVAADGNVIGTAPTVILQ